jgi:hypothetical protein
MKKSITITSILQSILTPEEVQNVVKEVDYEDKARSFPSDFLPPCLQQLTFLVIHPTITILLSLMLAIVIASAFEQA